MRHPDDKHNCPLLKKEILWGDCWIIQDVREDNTDMEFASEPFDLEEAKEVCDKCRWYQVNNE